VKLDVTGAMERRRGQRTSWTIRAPALSQFETLLTSQNEMYVHDLAAVSAQQRPKTRAHSARIKNDAASLVECSFEATAQLRKHLRAAAPLLVRERRTHRVRTQMQRRIFVCEARCQRSFTCADRSSYCNDETHD
jgi:hypothetical protein